MKTIKILLYVLFIVIVTGLEGMMIPVVLLYALSLTGMSLMAFNRLGMVSTSLHNS